jgi:hypothetical protein
MARVPYRDYLIESAGEPGRDSVSLCDECYALVPDFHFEEHEAWHRENNDNTN